MNTCCFGDLGSNDVHAMWSDPHYIDFDMKNTFQGKFCRNLPGNYIQVLKSLENSCERAGV